MARNVIPFGRVPDTQHASGEAFCVACDHNWIAVVPTGATFFQCPNCRSMKGRWKFEFYPSADQRVMTCPCKNQLYYLTPDGHMCANCGLYVAY